MDQSSDIDAWKRVHRQLTLAMIQSQDNIAAELTKKRYLLEEMNRRKMQNMQKSAPGSSSVSKAKKKAAVPKKVAPPKKEKLPNAVVKTAKKVIPPSTSSAKSVGKVVPSKANASKPTVLTQLGVQKTERVLSENLMAGMVAQPTVMGTGDEALFHENTNKQANNDGDTNMSGVLHPTELHYPETMPQQMSQIYYPPAPYGMFHGNLGMGMATPEAMGLAVQMMQQFNQNTVNEGGDESDSAPTSGTSLKHI